ncbi:MAG: crossover junction endodeoxyribonuclease RuvC [candidate division Zixibacteria bacterium]|jgi:crossover junction endodeoxyribonuclease RuvC|nr:crossover junction endodeoxyribonuclease RuvC [candidate division Zixibacteria bacterium]
MVILGIDPGLDTTGYGLIDFGAGQYRVIEAGVVRSTAKLSLSERLGEIARDISSVLAQFSPEGVAVEELYAHYNHPRTAIIMGHARGVIFLAAAQAGVPVYSYAATKIKKSLTGNGRATKLQMQRMVASTLNLSTVPQPPDAADALAVALCHCRVLEVDEGVAV